MKRDDADRLGKALERFRREDPTFQVTTDEETGQTVEKIQADSDRNFWMSAEEALGYGVISRIVTKAGDVV